MSTISNYHIATLRLRSIALCIDLSIIVLYALCLFGVTFTFYQLAFGGVPNILSSLGIPAAHLLGFATLTFPVGLYFFLTEAGRYHATWGKRAVGIAVRSKKQAMVSRKQIALRTIVKLLPWEFAHTFIYYVIYYSNNALETPAWVMVGLTVANIVPILFLVTILCRKDRAGPHDLVARTLVTTKDLS